MDVDRPAGWALFELVVRELNLPVERIVSSRVRMCEVIAAIRAR